MITLTAKINLFDADENAAIEEVQSTVNNNNISSGFEKIINSVVNTKNPFIIGYSKIGDGSTLQTKLDYFMGGVLGDDTGTFSSPQVFFITTTYELSSLSVAFDSTYGGHPLHVLLDGVSHYVNSAEYTFGGIKSKGQHTLQILDWNKPNRPVVISGIYTNITIEIDRRNLLSMNIDLPSKADNSMPSFGIISSQASVSFNDVDGKVENYADQGLLVGGLVCETKIINTLKKAEQTIGVFETSEWNYDAINRSVSVSMKDGLEEWQDIHVEGISYNPSEMKAWTGYDVYEYLYEQTPAKYKMLSVGSLNNQTLNILQNTIIPFKFLSSGSLWSQWQKLCTVCMAYIYKKADGQTTFSYRQGA